MAGIGLMTTAVPLQVTSLLFGLVAALFMLVILGLVLWGLYALTESLFSASDSGGAGTSAGGRWQALADHPDFSTTERYGEGSPEVETTVRGRRVVGRVETAPGGTDRYAVLETAMLSVRAGTGFELATDEHGRVQFVDRGPDAPPLPDAVWTTLNDLRTFGGLTVDDRTGIVEHRFPDPSTVAAGETLRRQAEALVAVAETVEEYAESSQDDRHDPTGTGRSHGEHDPERERDSERV